MSEPVSMGFRADWLSPPAYQRDVVALLKQLEPEAWRMIAAAPARADEADAVRTGLLKSTYRLDGDTHADLLHRALTVAERVGCRAPLTLYQSSGNAQMNAGIVYLPGEAHIVFSGPLLKSLAPGEVDAIVGHELTHQRLWELDDGDFQTADRLLMGAAEDGRCAPAHLQTARRYRLYTEILADRGSLVGCGDLHTAVAALVKVETGLAEVSAAGYLRQADEIFARGDTVSEGLDHPEAFIRARALRLWAEQDPSLDAWIARAIEGTPAIDTLDLAGQRRFAASTRRLLGQLLRPRWFQTDAVLAHARAFFADFEPAREADDAPFDGFATADAATQEYLAYVLLEFAAVDPDLEEVALPAALAWSDRLGIAAAFEKIAAKELDLGKRQLAKIRKEGPDRLARAEAKP